jgi:hypothetical protein
LCGGCGDVLLDLRIIYDEREGCLAANLSLQIGFVGDIDMNWS